MMSRYVWMGTGLALMAAVAIAAAPVPAMAAAPSTCDAANVVARALPAVVNIWVAKILPAKGSDEGPGGGGVMPADGGAKAPGRDQLEFFVGTGFVVDSSGVIVTNKHVIQDAAMIRVTFHDRSQVPAQLIAASSLLDFAMLKVNVGKPLATLRYADSDAVQVGEPVIAVGNPLGLGTSVSTGVISAVNRNLMRSPLDDYIQTDASINPGNSGGPLLDCSGEVVGINTALLSNNKVLGSIGIGFAMPSNDAALLTGKLMDPDHVKPNWIGVQLQDLTPALAQSFGSALTGGAIVTRVDKDGPAARASLAPGDIVTAVDGDQVYEARAILRAVVVKPPGEPITLSVWHAGRTRDVTLRGEAWPHMMAGPSHVLASAASIARAEAAGPGLHLVDLSPAVRKRFGLSETSGVVVAHVTPGSEAASLGLEPGNVITMVGDDPVKSASAVNARFDHPESATGDLVPLLVQDQSAIRWVTIFVGRIKVSNLIATIPEEEPAAGGTAGTAAAPHR
jgi:serine protease Do